MGYVYPKCCPQCQGKLIWRDAIPAFGGSGFFKYDCLPSCTSFRNSITRSVSEIQILPGQVSIFDLGYESDEVHL